MINILVSCGQGIPSFVYIEQEKELTDHHLGEVTTPKSGPGRGGVARPTYEMAS